MASESPVPNHTPRCDRIDIHPALRTNSGAGESFDIVPTERAVPAPGHGPVAVFKDRVPDRFDGFSCNTLLNRVPIHEHHEETIGFGTGYVGEGVFGGVVDRVGTHASDA